MKGFVCILLAVSLSLLSSLMTVYGVTNYREEDLKESLVIVSMGDSYSSGEGITPYYGQDEPLKDRVRNQDWLAHRSQYSWPGMLKLPALDWPMSEYKDENWFFVATSGAVTDNISNNEQIKQYNKCGQVGYTKIDKQIEVFKNLKGKKADYVTITIGGNDVGFADIIKSCVRNRFTFCPEDLNYQLSLAWASFETFTGVQSKIKQVYRNISKAAGSQAYILVVGYPRLLDQNHDFWIRHEDSEKVNDYIGRFNGGIREAVEDCASEGINIRFIRSYDKFIGHGAFSKDAYISGITLISRNQDLKFDFVSASSIHPNIKGAEAYAKGVQEEIDKIEEFKKWARTEDATRLNISIPLQTEIASEAESANSGDEVIETVVSDEQPEDAVSDKNTHIALLLDVSKSMKGEPLDKAKESSIKFIDTALEEDVAVGLIQYYTRSDMVSGLSTDKDALNDLVTNLTLHGGTNIEAGLNTAYEMLKESNAERRLIVLMSDGEPNDGLEGEELIAYADTLKDSGIGIYTIGFFDELSDKSRAKAQKLMEGLASTGNHYEVSGDNELVYCFEDVADQINGQKYAYVRIACPVDVRVEYNGEVLDSSVKSLSTRTSFGTLTLEDIEGKSDTIKTLRLKEGVDYKIYITGTGQGTMDYIIGFSDDEGKYTDLRTFEDVKVIRGTKIDTIVPAVADEIVLNIDNDGDGKYDLKLKSKDGTSIEAIEVRHMSALVYVVICMGAFVVLVLLFIHKKHKTNKATERN